MNFFDTEPITIPFELEGDKEEIKKKLDEIFYTPDGIRQKIMDVMQYMLEHHTSRISYEFADGKNITVLIEQGGKT